ncbi:hypothetical protein [Clostridium tagluense]|uniref:hypothetical protein n=1 Tax=Clostridium tagluense TaxID=360422 RepID=UPI001C0B0604|nr:hypothetical protein [Clostridium tagluense]MBU3130273.1 hypothetical protein [Clostridium tagluense]
MKRLENYLSSDFYKKYKNTYHSDKILKEVFNCELKFVHRIRSFGKKKYSDIYGMNIHIITDFIDLYYQEMLHKDYDIAWKMIYSFYLDPDSVATKSYGDILCSADGLLSIKRIYSHKGLTTQFISEYETYRRVPIIYFPQETNGINMTRASVFGDRIDYTLFDLKKYFEAKKSKTNVDSHKCRLISAYELPKTSDFLHQMGSFENLIDWLNIKGIFTSEQYEVYDIEKGDDSIITDYLPEYSWNWSDEYYINIKEMIDKYLKLLEK